MTEPTDAQPANQENRRQQVAPKQQGGGVQFRREELGGRTAQRERGGRQHDEQGSFRNIAL